MLRISNIRLDLSSRLSPLLSTGEFKMEWVPISKYVSSNYIYVFLNYIYVWSNSWLGETVCKCRKTNTTRGETRTQKHGIEVRPIHVWMYDENSLMTDSNCNMVHVVTRSIYTCTFSQDPLGKAFVWRIVLSHW